MLAPIQCNGCTLFFSTTVVSSQSWFCYACRMHFSAFLFFCIFISHYHSLRWVTDRKKRTSSQILEADCRSWILIFWTSYWTLLCLLYINLLPYSYTFSVKVLSHLLQLNASATEQDQSSANRRLLIYSPWSSLLRLTSLIDWIFLSIQWIYLQRLCLLASLLPC